MERAQHQVAGQRGLNGDLGRFPVSHLANHHDIRIMAQHTPERARERQPDGRVDLRLADAPDFVFDRILDRDDLTLAGVEPAQASIQRRALAASGRSGYHDYAVRLSNERFHLVTVILRQAQLFQVHEHCGRENSYDHILAVKRWNDRHTQVIFLVPHAHAHAAVLRQATLNDVQRRHELHARHD